MMKTLGHLQRALIGLVKKIVLTDFLLFFRFLSLCLTGSLFYMQMIRIYLFEQPLSFDKFEPYFSRKSKRKEQAVLKGEKVIKK
jgi:hypothetical protein